MMRFKFLSILFFLLISAKPLLSQTISGHIRDVETNQFLNNASVQVIESLQATTTDKNGFFQIKLNKNLNKATLKVKFMGFADTNIVVSTDENNFDIRLRPSQIELETVMVTANRYEENISNVPARAEIISNGVIEKMPITNTDEVLLNIPGTYTDRDFGIFSKNASVIMRGLNSSQRVLVMQNGAPLNKADGGGVNWNRIDPEDIQQIEVIKGPSSAIYGGNAMAGVINVITRKPKEKFSGSIEGSAGSFNTYGFGTHVGGRLKDSTGLYYTFSTFFRKGDGYYVNTPENRTQYDTTVFLREGGINGIMGYTFKNKSELEMEYNYWDDMRSDGVRVFEKLGSYNKYTTNAARLSYKNKIKNGDLTVQSTYQNEYYFHQNEAFSKKNLKYKRYDAPSNRNDYGLFSTYSLPTGQNNRFTFGCDLKMGTVTSDEIYFTSTDVTHKKGQTNQYALFGVYDINAMNNKLNISLGLRYDLIQFLNGSFIIETPSALTDFIKNYPSQYADENWNAFSPKAGAKYHFNDNVSAYISFSTGYNPAMLDDMCTNRSVTKGFKLANPKLAPEYLYNYETGLDYQLTPKLKIELSFYNSIGHGFHAFVGTGDSVDTGGDSPKPVLIRDNIALVKIYGNETAITYFVAKNLTFSANYAFNYAYIAKFQNKNYEDKDLQGKILTNDPEHLANAFLFYTFKKITAVLSFHYISGQWNDDENTSFMPSYNYTDIKIGYSVLKSLKASLLVSNIFDNKFIDNKEQLCPGRFFIFQMKYLFK